MRTGWNITYGFHAAQQVSGQLALQNLFNVLLRDLLVLLERRSELRVAAWHQDGVEPRFVRAPLALACLVQCLGILVRLVPVHLLAVAAIGLHQTHQQLLEVPRRVADDVLLQLFVKLWKEKEWVLMRRMEREKHTVVLRLISGPTVKN